MYSGHSCKVSRAAGAVPTRLFTPLHTPVHSDFFRGNACNPSGTARRALSRPPGPLERRRRGRPHPRRRAHPGRRRPGRGGGHGRPRPPPRPSRARRRGGWPHGGGHWGTALRRSLRACTSAGAPARARRRRRRRPRGARAPISRPAALESRTAPPARWQVAQRVCVTWRGVGPTSAAPSTACSHRPVPARARAARACPAERDDREGPSSDDRAHRIRGGCEPHGSPSPGGGARAPTHPQTPERGPRTTSATP